jgi:HAD superfamily hydrolase (TIGR01490 family)
LAVFDLDGTLIRGDSFLPFAVGYARANRRMRPLATLPIWLGLYAARLMPDHRAKERVLMSFFRGECPVRVSEYATAFSESWIRPRLREPVFARLTEHLSDGHRVVLLSASPDLCVEPVGRALGIGEVLCTRTRRTPTACEGALDGPNCKGEQKLVRLRAHLGMETWSGESFAYGDSSSDLPVLQWATHGFLVGRSGELSRVSPAPPPRLIRS